MKKTFILFLIIGLSVISKAQNPPTGWKFGGALPEVAYDSDVGIRYGALGNVYDWGDGSTYPNYVRSIYAEWSQTTKGSGITRLQYDDKQFFGTKIRFTSELGYYKEQALDFYGFNGLQSIFNVNYSTNGSADYKSRMFYRIDRRLYRGIFDFQIPVSNHFKIYAGINLFFTKIGSVNIDKLNRGKDPEDMLPSVDSVPGVYEKYLTWGIIDPNEATGGFVPIIKSGIIYDTRNSEALATKGLWDEAFIIASPGFGKQTTYFQLVATHRQYFGIIPNRLSIAYRLAFVGKIGGTMPFYMMPYYFTTREVFDGIGGSKSFRGVLRDRIVANSVAIGTGEIRWRVINTKLFKQDFYIALSTFVDAARIIVPYDVDLTNVPLAEKDLFFNSVEDDIYKFHLGYGAGIRFALNENFIVAVDYGLADNPQDGSTGLYIGLNWAF